MSHATPDLNEMLSYVLSRIDLDARVQAEQQTSDALSRELGTFTTALRELRNTIDAKSGGFFSKSAKARLLTALDVALTAESSDVPGTFTIAGVRDSLEQGDFSQAAQKIKGITEQFKVEAAAYDKGLKPQLEALDAVRNTVESVIKKRPKYEVVSEPESAVEGLVSHGQRAGLWERPPGDRVIGEGAADPFTISPANVRKARDFIASHPLDAQTREALDGMKIAIYDRLGLVAQSPANQDAVASNAQKARSLEAGIRPDYVRKFMQDEALMAELSMLAPEADKFQLVDALLASVQRAPGTMEGLIRDTSAAKRGESR